MAWLASSLPAKDGAIGESRYAMLTRLSDDPDYQYPDPGDAQYLINYLHEIGEAIPIGGGGLSPIPWQEIMAWSFTTGTSLNQFEASAIRQLSVAYADYYNRANGRDFPMPMVEMTDDKRDRVAKKAEAFISMLRR